MEDELIKMDFMQDKDEEYANVIQPDEKMLSSKMMKIAMNRTMDKEVRKIDDNDYIFDDDEYD